MKTTSKSKFTEESLLENILNLSIGYAGVFDKYDIDFGNYGKMTIKEAADSIKLNPTTLISELNKKEIGGVVCRNINDWDLVFLCDFITANLHTRIKSVLQVFENTYRVLFREGLIQGDIRKLSSDFTADIQSHIQKEQRMLYPYIKQMSAAAATNSEIQMAPFGLMSKPVKALMREHLQITEMADILGRMLKEIDLRGYKLLSDQYETDPLTELKRSFRLHIHFENNILFPRAVALERKIFKLNRKTSLNKSKNKCS